MREWGPAAFVCPDLCICYRYFHYIFSYFLTMLPHLWARLRRIQIDHPGNFIRFWHPEVQLPFHMNISWVWLGGAGSNHLINSSTHACMRLLCAEFSRSRPMLDHLVRHESTRFWPRWGESLSVRMFSSVPDVGLSTPNSWNLVYSLGSEHF